MIALVAVLSLIAIGIAVDRSRRESPAHGTAARQGTVYFAVKNRAAGSPSVYWGPFESPEAVTKWANQHRIQVGIIEALDPQTPESKWW